LQNRKKRVSCNDQTSTYDGLTLKEIKAEMANVHSTSAPATIYNWVNLNVVIHPHVMPRSGHSIEAAMPEIKSIKSTMF